MDPFLTVIIPSYNRAEKLSECLARLSRQSLAQEAYEIIVVDDGSTDNTSDVLKAWEERSENLHVLTQKNQGQGIARNKAIQVARGQIILFIGDDIYASENFLEKHVIFHKEHPEENFACLGLTEWDPNHEITPFMEWMTDGGYQFNYSKLQAGQEASFWFFYTSNLSLKKSLLQKHPFDTDFKGYGWEDTELGLRLTKKENLKLIYTPQALAHHDHLLKEEDLSKKMTSLAKNAKIFKAKHPELKVIPSGFKKLVLLTLSSLPFRAFLRALKPFSKHAQKAYWYLSAKHYFLKSLRSI